MHVPTVDLNWPDDKIHRAMDEACRQLGFFQLLGHGIEQQQHYLSTSREFFHLPMQEKNTIQRSADNPWGFFDAELTKNRRDWKEILDIGPPAKPSDAFASAQTQWPVQPSTLKPSMRAYMQTCETLADRLLCYIADNLRVDRPTLQQQFGSSHTSFLRLNYYPVCPEALSGNGYHDQLEGDEGVLGISHHTDAGALTLLMQDQVAGLQVWHDGRWLTVPTNPEALVVNIGDVVQVWSNNQYPAPLHRVLANDAQERFSAAYFYNPSYSATYAPLPSTGAPQYRPINWGEFRAGRAAGDYADSGEEIQISHYAIG